MSRDEMSLPGTNVPETEKPLKENFRMNAKRL
jgi:hypothetical protein